MIPDVVIVGPGAIGLLLGARLSRAGIDVWLRDHRPERAERLARDGIVVEESDGSSSQHPVGVWSGDRDRAPVLAFVCVKATAMAAALEDALRSLPDESPLVVLSNGLGHERAVDGLAGRLHLGVVTFGALLLAEGRVAATGSGVVRLGGPEVAIEALGRAGFEVEVRRGPDLERAIWEKAAINCGINPVATLLGVVNGELQAGPALEVATSLAVEAASVANRERNDPEFLPGTREAWRERIRGICERTAGNRCSMSRDVDEGRPTEIEALCGEVSRRAQALGMEAPLNGAFADLIRARSSVER